MLFVMIVTLVPNNEELDQPQRSANPSINEGESLGNKEKVVKTAQIQSFSQPVTPTLSTAVRDLPLVSADRNLNLAREVNPRIGHQIPKNESSSPFFAERVVEIETTELVETTDYRGPSNNFLQPSLNIAGMGFNGVNPPDPAGAVGKDHYIQMINSPSGTDFVIYDKDGNLLSGPTALDSLGTGDCADGGGDPVVIYDQLADRWFMSEFNSTFSKKTLCHYVSQTSDPLGAWHAYIFVTPSFPDYPKYGLWTDAYIGTANESSPTFAPAIYAFDRENMLAGDPAGFIRFAPDSLSGFGFQALAPADLDSMAPPPAGSTPLYLRHVDDESHNISDNPTSDFIEIWTIDPDFDTPANSTFSRIANIAIPEFDSNVCGLTTFRCVPQNGSSTLLDPIREVLMNRVSYLNFGSHETIVVNMVTDANNSDLHAIYWLELRNSTGSWELHQQGVFSPDDQHRWMGSIGMDESQNIALLYNISGSSTFPTLRYTGRTADMPLGQLMSSETTIGQGTAANSSNRYGDYSTLTLDPTDGCTFWATGQYNPASSWGTRIASFKFPDCTRSASFFLQQSDKTFEFLEDEDVLVSAVIQATEGYTQTVNFIGGPSTSGTVLSISPPSIQPGPTPTTVTVAINNAIIGTNAVTLTASSPSQIETISIDFIVVPTLTTGVTLIAPENNETYVSVNPTFEWSELSGATSYELQLTEGTDFTTPNNVITGILTTTYSLPSDLETQTLYSWRVRPVNKAGPGPWASASFTTAPPAGQCLPGETPSIVYQTGFEDGLTDWTLESSDGDWEQSADQFSEGAFSAKGETLNTPSYRSMVSPELGLALSADARWVKFDLWRNIEGDSTVCYDGLTLDYSSGSGWSPLGQRSETDPYDSTVPVDLSNPLAGQDAWCGNQTWTENLIDISDLSGGLQLRFTIGSDESISDVGAYVDNLTVYECNPQNNPLNRTFFFPGAWNNFSPSLQTSGE